MQVRLKQKQLTSPRRKDAIIVGFAIAFVGLVFCVPRFTDPLAYFNFADQRKLFGIPNIMDVISNAPFAVIGILGLCLVHRKRTGPDKSFTAEWERLAYGVLFAAVGSVAAGSAYFHLAPDPGTLFWDRLPMTIVFMSFLALTIAERIDMRMGRLLFFPLLALGIGSVLYWRYTEAIGRGDVRWYLLIQFFPIIAIPIMFVRFPARYTRTSDLVAVLSLYALAKLFELCDARVFAITRVISGHTLKHLAGALAAFVLLRAIRVRRLSGPPVETGDRAYTKAAPQPARCTI